jgi:Kyakuja-Dileera-Zisupton transposase
MSPFINLISVLIRASSTKYALAIVDWLIDNLGGKVSCAYDIGCAFSKMLENSSLLEKAKNALFCLMVGAFHGHAHN